MAEWFFSIKKKLKKLNEQALSEDPLIESSTPAGLYECGMAWGDGWCEGVAKKHFRTSHRIDWENDIQKK